MYELLQELEVKVKILLEQRNQLTEDKHILLKKNELLNFEIDELRLEIVSLKENIDLLKKYQIDKSDEQVIGGMIVKDMLDSLANVDRGDLK